MVKYIKNLLLYWRFKRAVKQCDKLNKKYLSTKYIVANICGHPYIIDRKAFRKLRTNGFFRSDLKWQDVFHKRITANSLQQWIS